MIEYAIFLQGLGQQWRPPKKLNLAHLHKGSLGDEDDAERRIHA